MDDYKVVKHTFKFYLKDKLVKIHSALREYSNFFQRWNLFEEMDKLSSQTWQKCMPQTVDIHWNEKYIWILLAGLRATEQSWHQGKIKKKGIESLIHTCKGVLWVSLGLCNHWLTIEDE